MTLDERKFKLVKSCLNSCVEISLCARIRSTDSSFLYICNKYDVHCEISSGSVSHITLRLNCIIC